MTFVDIGANVGFFTVIAARLVGPAGHVYAFEPVPENCRILSKNVRRNRFSNVRIFECAVSDVVGHDQLMLAEYCGGAALSIADRPPDQVGSMQVAVTSLDNMWRQGEIRGAAVIKIDVEGAELQVLRGMELTLNRDRPIVIYEIDGPDLAVVKRKSVACRALLESQDYEVSRLEDSYPDARWCVKHFAAFPGKRTCSA